MIDLTFLEKFTKGNTVKMKRYIRMYLLAAPQILGRMKTDIENNDWTDLSIQAHSLKPQVDFMGISSLKKVLVDIEKKVKTKETSGLSNLVTTAMELHQAAELELKNKLIDD